MVQPENMDVAVYSPSQRRLVAVVAFFLSQVLSCGLLGQVSVSVAPPALTIKDSIEISRLADSDYFIGNLKKDHVAHFSPNGKSFFIVSRKADLATNSNLYSIILFKALYPLERPFHRTVLQLRSTTNYPAISDARWLSDNRTITFLGAINNGKPQVYAFQVGHRRLRQLTHRKGAIIDYRTTMNGRELVYLIPASDSLDKQTERRFKATISVTGQALSDILRGQTGHDLDRHELFAQQIGRHPVELASSTRLEDPTLDLSPDGRFVIVSTALKGEDLNPSWRNFSYSKDDDASQYFDEADRYRTTPFTRPLLIDTTTGEARTLWNGPNWHANTIAWARDSRSVFLKTLRLTNQVDAMSVPKSDALPAVDVRVDISTLQWKQIEPNEWPRAQDGKEPVIVSLEEDVNNPPKLWVEDRQSGKRRMIFDLNPQLSQKTLGCLACPMLCTDEIVSVAQRLG